MLTLGQPMAFREAEEFQEGLNKVIYASRAITELEHLKGRKCETDALTKALLTPGRQPFIFGMRGAGKTSLALSVSNEYSQAPVVQITCAPQMKFGDIIRTLVARALTMDPLLSEQSVNIQAKAGLNVGFANMHGGALETKSYRGVPTPNDPNEALDLLKHVHVSKGSKRFCFVIDEFDQLIDQDAHLQLGLLAKLIADSGAPIQFVFCGVADNIQQIFKAHPSTLRLFEAIEVNRLSLQACFEIMVDVERAIGVEIERETKFRIAQISDGFPYFIHLIVEKTLWEWFNDGIARERPTSPVHYERGLTAASIAAAPELREPYEKAANKYALDGELILWAMATGHLLSKQIKVVSKDFVELYDEYRSSSKPSLCLKQNQISARLAHFMKDQYGKMVVRPHRSYYAFAEKRMRGYARLRAGLHGVHLRPDHPLIPDGRNPLMRA
ncbi:MAG: AAA family ATPase [Pseudomonadota bacterium]